MTLAATERRERTAPGVGRTLAEVLRVTMAREGGVVLREVSFAVRAGDRVGVLGPNGAGKTTLLRLLLGLEIPTSGVVSPCARGVGYVPQAYAESLFPWFSMLENVAMPCIVARRDAPLDRARALCAALLPGLDVGRRAARFSGGEKQAAAIARALATPSDLVIADEPFSAIAASARQRARAVMRDELAGRALVLVTHDESDVADLCDRVVHLDAGVLSTRTPEAS